MEGNADSLLWPEARNYRPTDAPSNEVLPITKADAAWAIGKASAALADMRDLLAAGSLDSFA